MNVRRKVMRPRGDMKLEYLRKAVHIFAGLFVVLLVQAGVLDAGILGLLTLLAAAVVLFNYSSEKELLMRVISINRPDAKVPGLDMLSYVIGMWLVLAAASVGWISQEIAFAAIMIVAVGDPLAHLVSRSFGGTSAAVTPHSYSYGVIAGTLAGALAAWVYVDFLWGLVASALAMFVEAGELRIADHHIDDNLTIPIVAAMALWVISLAF